MFPTTAFVACLAALAQAAPAVETIDKRSPSTCAQYGTISASPFTIFNNLWGEGGATGSQCTTYNSLSNGHLAWSTAWSWSGGSGGIKSYANAQLNFASTQISRVSSIPTTWSWSYTGSSLFGDVAYDTFTSNTAGGSNAYEVMIWMASLGGAKPISSNYNAQGVPVAIATVAIGGYSWNLYKGPNNGVTVYSFLPASGQQITKFSGDVMNFYNYLIKSQGFPTTQYLITLQAGTEPTTGSKAVFTTSDYTMSFNG